ncbi:MAG: hypothetical protein V4703_12790 [Actinomycetota bacterium]
MSGVALLLISDGRDDYLKQTMRSATEMLPVHDHFIHVDDSAHELGFAGAVQEGWRLALETGATHVFHLEQDFTFRRAVDFAAMIRVFDHHPYLVQLALLRQPWNDAERAAGGIIEQHPGSYTKVFWDGLVWREHRRFVTTNPALWPRWVLERGWPDGPHSEGRFGVDLFASDENLRAAFWGDTVWVDHIGAERAGVGY